MAIPEVSGYAVVLSKHHLSDKYLAAIRSQNPTPLRLEDEDLMLIRFGDTETALHEWKNEASAMGLVDGQDYAQLSFGHGIVGRTPSWLNVELAPTGNPVDLEAKMDPQVRAMWQASRRLMYTLKQPA